MFKTIIRILLIFIIIGCDTTDNIDFKKGTFVVLVEGVKTTYIERNEMFQLEHSVNEEENELFKIKWLSERKYVLDDIVRNDSNDLQQLIVRIDSFDKNSYYQTSYVEGIDLKFRCKIEKINDDVSEEFIEMIEKLSNVGNVPN